MTVRSRYPSSRRADLARDRIVARMQGDLKGVDTRVTAIEDAQSPSGAAKTVRSVSATGSVLPEDEVLLVDAGSGPVSLGIPSSLVVSGRELSFKLTVGPNTLTIVTEGSETIDGAATRVLSAVNDAVTLISDGSDWWVI